MNHERLDRALFAANIRKKGTLLSNEAVDDVCEALLELVDDGSISLELHDQLMGKLRAERDEAERGRGQALADLEAERQAIDSLRPHNAGCNWESRGDAYPCSCALEPFRLRADLAELMRYVDEAEVEAEKLGRVSGEPLAEFLARLREAGTPRGPELDEVIRNGERD